MEPNWGGFYSSYYPNDPNRQPDRTGPNPTGGGSSHHDDAATRRILGQPSSFPPPPPPQMGQHQNQSHGGPTSPPLNLPPFSHSFYSSYHQSPNSSMHTPNGPPAGPLNLSTSFGSSHSGPNSSAYTPNSMMTSPTIQQSNSMPRGLNHPRPLPPGQTGPTAQGGPVNSHSTGSLTGHGQGGHAYSESPRIQGLSLGYSSSPNVHHFSPTSPTTHLLAPGIPSSNASSGSSFPSLTRTPLDVTKRKGRSGSGSDSWDESDKNGAGLGERPRIGEETDEQPWGMPQEQYKALNPRDKKQVRNRIGARRFRAKRKDYVSNLETNLRAKDEEINSLRNQTNTYRAEINDLRSRLGMPMLSPQIIPSASSGSGLGLLVSQSESEGWGDLKDE